VSRTDTSRSLAADLAAHRRDQAEDAAGRLALETEIESVTDNAGPVWRDHALAAVRKAAELHPELTVDDVHPHLSMPCLEPRALGGVMRVAARRRWIVSSGGWRVSTRPETHRRPLRVWRSRLCVAVAP